MTLNKAWKRMKIRLSRLWRPESIKTVIHANINGYSLLVLANEDVGRCIYYGRNFEFPETRFLEKIITCDSLCIDIGANVGYFTMLMAKNAPRGLVYAFEPIPLNASMLRTSAELNSFKNIEIIESVVGESNGEISLSQSKDSAYSSIKDTARKPVERLIQVRMVTLDSFTRQRSIKSIHVLKVDVEGAEGLVLNGARELLSDPERRPRVILMELFDANLAPYKSSSRAIIEMLRTFDYAPFFINDEVELIPFKAERLDTFYNVLFLNQSTSDNG